MLRHNKQSKGRPFAITNDATDRLGCVRDLIREAVEELQAVSEDTLGNEPLLLLAEVDFLLTKAIAIKASPRRAPVIEFPQP